MNSKIAEKLMEGKFCEFVHSRARKSFWVSVAVGFVVKGFIGLSHGLVILVRIGL
jgi:hypothetical protein